MLEVTQDESDLDENNVYHNLRQALQMPKRSHRRKLAVPVREKIPGLPKCFEMAQLTGRSDSTGYNSARALLDARKDNDEANQAIFNTAAAIIQQKYRSYKEDKQLRNR